jgi:hypothetical protein
MITLNFTAIKKAITTHFAAKNDAAIAAGIKPRRALTEKLQAEMIEAVQLVIAPQIADHLWLNLSDKEFADVLGTRPRRAKQIREELQAVGIIFVAVKQKKKGDYPLWLVQKGFLKFPNVEKKAWAPTTSNKYNSTYCALRDIARKDCAALVAEHYEEGLTGTEYGMLLNTVFGWVLADHNLTKEDLLK